MSGSDAVEPVALERRSGRPLLSLFLLSVPIWVVGLGFATSNPILVLPALGLVSVMVLDGRARAPGSRCLPAARTQLRRLVVGVELMVLLGAAVSIASLVMVLLQSVEALALGGLGIASAFGLSWALARKASGSDRLAVGSRLTSAPWAIALIVLALGIAFVDALSPMAFLTFLAALLALVATPLHWISNALRQLPRRGLDDGLATRLAWCGLLWFLVLVGVVLKTSPLGHYDLWSMAGPDGVHELTASRRASINSHGFRGPERPEQKPAGTLRVAVLGDSSSYGWMVLEPQTYARRLEQRLSEGDLASPVEVVNAAVPGYDLAMMMRRFVLRVRSHDPDVVVLAEGANDQLDLGTYRVLLDHAVGNLQHMGADVVLVGYPFSVEDENQRGWMNEVKHDVAVEHNARYVDLLEVARSMGPDFYLPDDSHPSVAGHGAIADALAPVIHALLATR